MATASALPHVPPGPPTRARRTNAQRSAATQTRLLDATLECLVELGWAGTSTTEVVRRAGVSRGAQVHHFPTKADLVLAAVEYLLDRRTDEFAAMFADLPLAERSPATAMRLLAEHFSGDTYAAWLELLVAARNDPALRARFIEFEARSFEQRLTTFKGMFGDAGADDAFARVALRMAFALLDGLGIDRLIEVDPAEIDAVVEAFNTITAPFFPHSPGGTP
jgi:AcrR family transcriptional regulator